MSSVIGGSFLGAAFGYGFARYLGSQNTRARRKFLIDLLREELAHIDTELQPYVAARVIYQDPIYLVALDQLLSGNVVDPAREPDVVRQLIDLKVALTRYNDFVGVTNEAQATTALSDQAHRQIYTRMAERHGDVVKAKERVEKALGSA
jgi:hypothetical protein